MLVPGFTAAASMYKTSKQYYPSAARGNYGGPPMVMLQQLDIIAKMSCTGTNGDKCWCPTGCKQKTSTGSCCCTADANCFVAGGGVFSPI
jgi:hypothetical protein